MDVAVVGAGVAGLTAAAELARAGFRVLVLEREAAVGGLARSFRYGPFLFDIGPHRFFSPIRRLRRYINAVLGDERREIERRSSVYLNGRYYPWPLRLLPLVRLGPRTLASAALDLVHRPPFDGRTFESLALSRYGRTLYNLFIRTATLKLTTAAPTDLHYTWLTQSVDRAIIDRREKFSSLLGVLRVMLRPRVRTRFVYPSGGCGVYGERLRARIERAGGTVLTGVPDVGVEAAGDAIAAVTASGRRWPVRALIWTAPVTRLAELLGLPDPGLRYTDTILYNVEVDRPVRVRDQWVYYGELKYLFSRLSFPRLFDPANVPAGRDAICLELLNTRPAWWADPLSVVPDLARQLAEAGLCRPRHIRDVHVERIRDSYPVYRADYPERLADLMARLARYRNLLPLGRCGRFEYNNMDDSIRDALAVAADLRQRLR